MRNFEIPTSRTTTERSASELQTPWRNVRESNPVNPLQVVRISSALHYRPAHVPELLRLVISSPRLLDRG